jgi:hypothetical protein
VNTYFMTGHPPVRIVADGDVAGSGPVESGQLAPGITGWRELAGAASPRIGTLDQSGFLQLLPSDGIVRGTALVPAIVAGADLSVFALGLFGMYLDRPDARERLDPWVPGVRLPGA